MGQLAQETEIVFSLRLCDKLLLCETAKLILMDTKPNTPKHTHTSTSIQEYTKVSMETDRQMLSFRRMRRDIDSSDSTYIKRNNYVKLWGTEPGTTGRM